MVMPVVQTSFDPLAPTPYSGVEVLGASGVGMMVQPFPFQCSVSGCAPVVLLPGLQRPTAQTSAAPIAKTALKRLFPGPTLGVGTTLQVLPSQCSANV